MLLRALFYITESATCSVSAADRRLASEQEGLAKNMSILGDKDMEHLRCVVERITYRTEENSYSVIKCRANGFADLVAVVGAMPDVLVGSVLSLGG